MNHQETAQAKNLVSFGHDVAYRTKLIEHHFYSINEASAGYEREKREIIQLLSEISDMSNKLYHAGMDALKAGEL